MASYTDRSGAIDHAPLPLFFRMALMVSVGLMILQHRGGHRSATHVGNQMNVTCRRRYIRSALKGIDTALKALEMFAKLSGQLQGPQHNHLHLHAEVPSREEAIEAARECLEVFAPHL